MALENHAPRCASLHGKRVETDHAHPHTPSLGPWGGGGGGFTLMVSSRDAIAFPRKCARNPLGWILKTTCYVHNDSRKISTWFLLSFILF